MKQIDILHSLQFFIGCRDVNYYFSGPITCIMHLTLRAIYQEPGYKESFFITFNIRKKKSDKHTSEQNCIFFKAIAFPWDIKYPDWSFKMNKLLIEDKHVGGKERDRRVQRVKDIGTP